MSITIMFFIVEFNKIKYFLKRFIFGIIIGASMMIPGFSGGTAAIILGVFYEIMESLNIIFKNTKKSLKLLLPYALGGGLGIVLISFPLRFIQTKYQLFFGYFIIGIILGSLKCFAPKDKLKINDFTWILFGIIPVALQYFLKYALTDLSGNYLFLIFVGLLASVALILPGISLTNILISFGCYEKLIDSIVNFDVLFLLVFVISLSAGVFICVKVILKIYNQHTKTVNLVLLGMVLASIIEIYPGLPSLTQTVPCVLLFISGVCCSLVFTRLEK